MATTSYGKITIIDVTDVGNFSVYPYANGPNTQIYSEETNTYYPNWAAQSGGQYTSPLVLTPVITYAGQDKTTDSTVNWYLKTDLEHPITTGGIYTVDSTHKTLTITGNIPTANTYIVYVVKASYNTETGAYVEAEGEITFNLLTQPSTIKNVSISGSNIIKYASNSNTPNPSTVTLTATLTGGTDITGDGWKYWTGSAWSTNYISNSGSGAVTGLTVNGTQLTVTASYNNSALYFNNDTARFKYVAHATADNTDIYEDIFTVFQLRDGASGDALVTTDLTNEDQLVPINKAGVPQWSAIGDLAKTTIYVYRGTNNITSNCNIKATLTNVTIELYNGSTKYTNTWNSGSNLPSGYYTVKVTGFTGGATSGSVLFETTVDGLNYSETFSLVGAPAGTDGNTPTIYTLEFPVIPALVNNPTGSATAGTLQDNWSYDPANLTINAYEITTDQNGTSSRSAYSGRVWYKPNIVNGSPAVDGQGNQTWGSLDLSNGTGTLVASTKLIADYSPYTFRLVGPSQSNIADNLKDEECINIVADGYSGNTGNDGDNAINLLINNENVTLNCTEAGKTRSTSITVGYQGYVGTAEDTHFQLNTSNKGSCSKNGLVTINNITTNTTQKTVTIPINANVSVVKGETGTITLNFLYTGGETNLTITKVISWDAKLDAKDGSDAIILTFEYGGNKTTYFKNETGSTTVTPVLIQNGSDLLDGKTAGTHYGITWTNLVTGNDISAGSLTNGKTLTVNATDISGVGSYSCTITYPLSSGSTTSDTKTYKQYVSFTDYSDPLQVELISTVGDKLTNGVGEGVVYPQTTREGTTLDQISNNSLVVWGSSSAPSNPADGSFYFNTSNNTLYERSSGSWVARSNYAQIIVLKTGNVNPIEVRNLSNSTYPNTATPSNLTYVWYFRDSSGNVLNPQNITDLKVSYVNGSTSPTWTTTQVTGGQFIYVNKNVIDNKITILCQVTKA